MECENVACSIQLKKSISLRGINGKPIIRCKMNCKLFAIKNKRLAAVNVGLHDLIIQSADTVLEGNDATSFEIIIENTTIVDSTMGVHSKNSINCNINIQNSIFKGESVAAIWLRCINLSAHITNSVFKRNPIMLRTIYNKHHHRSQTVEVLVRQSVFDGQYITIPTNLFSISPYALILNVSIWSSTFLNHHGKTKNVIFFPLLISDHNPNKRNRSRILLSNIKVENNLSPVKMFVTSYRHLPLAVEIMDSVFRNNSCALLIVTFFHHRRKVIGGTTAFLRNITFTQNFGDFNSSNPSSAIYFRAGKFQVRSCRFHNNKASERPSTGVVSVTEDAIVTFSDCHFENNQIDSFASQFYASGQTSVYFTGTNVFNITALNTAQTVFLRTPLHSENEKVVAFHGSFKVLCPQGFILRSQKICKNHKHKIGCAYVYINCERCAPKTYAIKRAQFTISASSNIICKPCPRGGNCLDGVVKARPNFWGYKANTSIEFAQCPPGYCCNSQDCVGYNSCHGNRTGTLCGRCASGMSDGLFSSSCISNANCSVSLFIPSAVGILVLYLIFFLYHVEIERVIAQNLFGSLKIIPWRRTPARNPRNEGNPRSGLLKVVFYYYQVVRLLQSTVGSQKRNHVIGKVEDFIARILNMVLVNPFRKPPYCIL